MCESGMFPLSSLVGDLFFGSKEPLQCFFKDQQEHLSRGDTQSLILEIFKPEEQQKFSQIYISLFQSCSWWQNKTKQKYKNH